MNRSQAIVIASVVTFFAIEPLLVLSSVLFLSTLVMIYEASKLRA